MIFTGGFRRFYPVVLAALFIWSTGTVDAQRVTFSGYGNLHYMNMDNAPILVNQDFNTSVLQLREFSVYLDAAVNDKILVTAELEAARNGTEMNINYGYVQWSPQEWLNIKAGKILVPFLRYNDEKINFQQSLMSPPFTASLLAPVVNLNVAVSKSFGWSDVGTVVEGIWSGPSGALLLTGGVMNGLASNDAALDSNVVEFADGTPVGLIRPRDGFFQNEAAPLDNNSDKAFVGRVNYQAVRFPLGLGVSVYRGKWDPEENHDLLMWGINGEYRSQRLEVKGELGRAAVEQEGGLFPSDVAPLGPNRTTGDYAVNALSVEGAWRVRTFSESKWLKAIVRYDRADTNDRAVFTPFNRSRITIGGEWQFTPDTRVRYEWQRTTLLDFDLAPPPIADSMGEHPSMHMISFIFWFSTTSAPGSSSSQ